MNRQNRRGVHGAVYDVRRGAGHAAERRVELADGQQAEL